MSTDRSIPVKTHGMFIVRESEHLSALPVSRAFNAYMDLTQISPHYVHERTKSWGYVTKTNTNKSPPKTPRDAANRVASRIG
jgi:hypothetical protein